MYLKDEKAISKIFFWLKVQKVKRMHVHSTVPGEQMHVKNGSMVSATSVTI